MKHMKHHDEKGRMHHAQSKIAKSMRPVEKKVKKAIGEFEKGKLHSGSKKGPLVKSKAQAEAIGYSEARRHKGKK